MRQWTLGSWAYEWNANGSLKSVKKPSGQTISFEYDALGRRIAKRSGNKEILYIWSGNVLLHEVLKTNDNEQVITWVYEQGSFVPSAKLVDNKSFSIISDYIGRPVLAFDENGDSVWSCDYDIYGKLINLQGDKSFIPFRQLGQYEDIEIGLYYNRFRYYDPNSGLYISQDPIGLAGGLSFYAYVHDVNGWVDIFGLSKYTPIEVLGRKVFQNSVDFGGGVPTFVDPIVGKTNPTVKKMLDEGASNYDLMSKGYAPIGNDGKQINLHHVIGIEPGSMVELLDSTHKKYYKPLHGLIEDGNSFRNNKTLKKQYEKFRKNYWKERAKSFKKGHH
ncbi:HNH/ENDO VII family nuclease [Capnocytophaga canimorsus]|uniref:HNH/ENDO VII family nuclease n=1 Tax=Capnocytophaga canimorsus TaxID=28188 RepID=UPI00385B22EB